MKRPTGSGRRPPRPAGAENRILLVVGEAPARGVSHRLLPVLDVDDREPATPEPDVTAGMHLSCRIRPRQPPEMEWRRGGWCPALVANVTVAQPIVAPWAPAAVIFTVPRQAEPAGEVVAVVLPES
jgi:hypothetical protein